MTESLSEKELLKPQSSFCFFFFSGVRFVSYYVICASAILLSVPSSIL